MKKSERQPFQILEEASKDILGNPRGSIDGPPSRDLLEEYGPDKEHIGQFVGRTPMRGKR